MSGIEAHIARTVAYYWLKEYAKAQEDVNIVTELGYRDKFPQGFIEDLKERVEKGEEEFYLGKD